MKLFDRAGKPVEVPDAQAHDALASGQYGAPKGTAIPVRMDGKIWTVPVENLTKAFEGGAEVVPQSVYDEAELQAKYGDAKHAALGAGTEFLNTATLGASDSIIGALSTEETKRDVRKSREANPFATGVATVAGIAAPIAADILSGGSLTPELAAAFAERAAVREGAAVAEGVAARRLAPEAANLARVEAPLARAETRVAPFIEGVFEEEPRRAALRAAELEGEILPQGLPGRSRPALPGQAIEGVFEEPLARVETRVPRPQSRRMLEIQDELFRPMEALPSRPLRALPGRAAEFEEVGVRAAQDAPEIAEVVSSRPPTPGPALPPEAVAAEQAARTERLADAAKVVEEARAAGAAEGRVAAEATGKGVVRQAVEGALFGPTRVVNGAGEAVESVVRNIIGREAETALGRIAQDAVIKTARGAVEGGIYNLGNEVGHQFLQDDPDLSGERLASAWFNGAVLGGGFGLATGALGRGAKEAITKVVGNEGVAKFLSDKAGEHMWHAAGATKKMTANAEKYAGGVAKVGNLIRGDAEQLMGRMPRTREELLELAGLMQKKHTEGMDAVLNRLDETRVGGDLRLKDVLKQIEKVEKELIDRAADHGTVTSFKNKVIDAIGARDPLTGEVNRNAPVSFKQLRNFRVTADGSAKFDGTVSNASRDGFKVIRRGLEDEIESAAMPRINEAGGSLLKDYKAAKAGYQAGKLLEKAAASGVAAHKTNQFFSLTDKIFGMGAAGAVGHVAGPLGAIAAHGGAEMASKYVRKNFDFVVSDVLAKLANVTKGAHVLDAAQATSERVQQRMDHGLNAVRRGLDGKSVGAAPVVTGPKSFEERRELLLNLAAQHEGVLEHLNTVTNPLNRAAPGVASSLNSAALRTVVYLMDALPKPPPPSKASLTPQIDAKTWKPSDPQKADFNRRYDMAAHPETAPALVASGAYTIAHDQALSATHPKMKAHMADKIRADLERRTKAVPAHMRGTVKLFLGVPSVDKSLGQMLQANYTPPQPAQSRLSKPLKMTDRTSLK